MVAQPKEIATGVYQISSRGSNIYFVRSGTSWVLIDTAWASSARPIREAAETLFGANARPAALLLTHAHPDHAGAALALARMWGVTVYIHPSELPLAEGSFATAEQYPAGPLDRWLILPLMRALPTRAVESITSKSSLKGVARGYEPRDGVPGLPDWECIPTPGHTPGHVAFFRSSDRVLIAGDALLTVNLNSLWDFLLDTRRVSGPPSITTWDWRAAQASVAALARLEPRVLACGHGAPMTGASLARKVHAFAEQFAASGQAQRSTSDDTAGGTRKMRYSLRHAMTKGSTGFGVWLYRLTAGRVTRLFGAPSEVLILTTRGRKSGQKRSVLLQGFRAGADLIVAASNVGQAANPGWYFNLKAVPFARVELRGSALRVRAEELSAEEAAAFWSHILSIAPSYGRYQRRTTRAIPLMRLTPVVASSTPPATRGEKVVV